MSYLSPYGVVFLVICSLSSAYHQSANYHPSHPHYSHGHHSYGRPPTTTPEPSPTFAERYEEFAEKRAKAYNENKYSATERDVGSALTKCPDYCKPKLGNGQCDEECNIDGCLADLGDCTTRRSCFEIDCPNDGKCRPICEMNSCVDVPVCKTEQMKLRQIAVLVSPSAGAKAVVKMTPQVEYMLSYNATDTLKKDLGGVFGPDVVFQSNKYGPLVWGHRGDYLMEQVKYNPDKQSVIQGGCTFDRHGSISVISIRDPLDRIITYKSEEAHRQELIRQLELGVINWRKAFEIVLLAVPEDVMTGIWGWWHYTDLYRPWKVGQFRFFRTHEIHSEINDKYIEDAILCGPTQ